MKAIKYLAPDRVETVETDVPTPGEGEALVKVHFAGICGSELVHRSFPATNLLVR